MTSRLQIENGRSRPLTSKHEAAIANKYTFEGTTSWRSYRLLRPGWGMYKDVRRRLPYYKSDVTDAFTYRVIASTIRMYFVK